MAEKTETDDGPLKQVEERVEERVEEMVGGPARLRIIALLSAVLGLDTADKATVSAVAGSLEQAFHIGAAEIGLLIAAVSFVGAIFALPMGVFVDRMRRKRLLVIVIALWSVAMVISGTASSYVYMLVARIGLGAVTAAASPAVASLTGDFFPSKDRAKVYGLILAGELVGTGIGFFVSGEVSAWLDWHWSFYVMGVPGAVLAWTIWRFLPEPARGGQSWIEWGQEEIRTEEDVEKEQGDAPDRSRGRELEQSAEAAQAQEEVLGAGVQPRKELILHEDPAEKSVWWAIGYVVRIPTYLLLIIASSLGYFFFSGVRGFGMIYLTGHYGISRGIAASLVIVLGIGGLIGVISGGRISSRLLAKGRPDARILVPGIALFISILLFAPGIWTTNVFLGIALLALGAMALAAANPPIDAARLDIVHPRLWGRAESGRMALKAALEGAAPILFGLVTEWLGGGDRALEWTYLIMLVPVAVAASLAIPARRTYLRDVATAAESVKETAKQPG
ncbi:MAG TPA: MFS transporter [Gammaproteobacteria bacterium]|nr:MFS transporter [Gammaproteobacteria bacterium]